MKYTLLFTGHMIDAHDRAVPRFPASKENAAKEEIRKLLLKEKETWKGSLRGSGSGGCGGDILFQELCIELNIPTEICLALPVDEFRSESVSFAGKNWDARFDELIQKLPVHILPETMGNNMNVWERANTWMLKKVLESGGENMCLIALWDGKKGDGEGGTAHMVRMAEGVGARVRLIDVNIL